MTRRKDIRKSDFTLVGSSQPTDTFDLVRNGQNLKIYQSDLVSDFGATGSLESRGEITAIPVLEVIANVNYIRNILGGSGIIAQLSPQDGVQISHNFDADTDAVPVMINSSSASPTIRSIQAGTGISVAGAGGIIQIASTEIPSSTKTIVVYDASDLPAPVGGIITLVAETEYKLQNDISISNEIVMSNNTILSGADRDLITLEYTGIDTFITAVDANVKIKDIRITCATGTLFDISSTTGAHKLNINSFNTLCDYVGTLDNLSSVHIRNTNFQTVYSDGFILSGTFYAFIMDLVGLNMPSGTGNGITLGTAVFTYFLITQTLTDVSTSGYSISGLANSGNIDPDGLGVITVSRNFGTATVSDNIFPTDDRWTFQLNAHVPDSYDTVLATHGGATIPIATALTPVLIGATWTNQKLSRFTGTAAGTWTYTGILTHVEIAASITANLTIGTDVISYFLYKNGVQVTDSRIRVAVGTTIVGNANVIWEDDLVNGDYFQLYVQNDDVNQDIEIIDATMRIRS